MISLNTYSQEFKAPIYNGSFLEQLINKILINKLSSVLFS